jgi:hypothetical protein
MFLRRKIGWCELQVNKVGYVERKLTLAFNRIVLALMKLHHGHHRRKSDGISRREEASSIIGTPGLISTPKSPMRSSACAMRTTSDTLHKPAQRKIPLLAAADKPDVMLAADTFSFRPPIWPGATPPVARKRRTHKIAVLIATPKRAAASCRDRPPCSTQATTRSRRSFE